MDLINEYLALAGFAALIALVINVLKYYGRIPDGQAGQCSAFGNLVGLIIFSVLKIYNPGMIGEVDSKALEFATIFNYVFAYMVQLGSSTLVYELFKKLNIPVLGFSNK